MAEKGTLMVLKVDLQCQRCYKKVKKVLFKFPQIRDQVYDEKNNAVIIKAFCCNPEKIRDKLCCKGRGSIKSIEIKEPEKPKTEPEKPKDEPEKPKPQPGKPKAEPEKPKGEPEKPIAEPPKPKPPPVGYPPCYPRGVCCGQCYAGQAGGPCYYWYGRPPPPPPSAGCDGYGYRYGYGYGYGHGYDYGWNRGCSVRRCGECFCDKNPAACRCGECFCDENPAACRCGECFCDENPAACVIR